MFGPLEEEQWDAEQALAVRWATTHLPWGHGIRPELLAGTATLIVTGG